MLLALVFAFLRLTPIGLAMRAAAQNPESARLVGIRVGWMLALGWGLAAAIGAVAGMMIAPIVFLEPNMMIGTLLYGFAGALLGGIDSPAGAVVGGFLVGVLENLIGTYVPFVGTDLKLTVALALIMLVLLLRPNGLFGRRVVQAGLMAHDRTVARAEVRPCCARRSRCSLVLAALLPLLLSDYRIFQLTLALVYAIAILGLNILTGYNGQFSLGHGAFYAIGAYTAAIMMRQWEIAYYWTLPAAGLVCFCAGFLFGFPALRLEGLYLALATFALAVATPQILKSGHLAPLTGGVQGIVDPQARPAVRPAALAGPVALLVHARRRAGAVRLRLEPAARPQRAGDQGDPRQPDRGRRDGHRPGALQDADLRRQRVLHRRRRARSARS